MSFLLPSYVSDNICYTYNWNLNTILSKLQNRRNSPFTWFQENHTKPTGGKCIVWTHLNPLPIYKGWMRFVKNDCNRGDCKFLLEMRGVLVLVLKWGGDGKFLKVSLHSWLTSLFYEKNPILPTLLPFFSNFVHPPTPLPCHLQPQPPRFFLLSCFFGWMGDHVVFYW